MKKLYISAKPSKLIKPLTKISNEQAILRLAKRGIITSLMHNERMAIKYNT